MGRNVGSLIGRRSGWVSSINMATKHDLGGISVSSMNMTTKHKISVSNPPKFWHLAQISPAARPGFVDEHGPKHKISGQISKSTLTETTLQCKVHSYWNGRNLPRYETARDTREGGECGERWYHVCHHLPYARVSRNSFRNLGGFS